MELMEELKIAAYVGTKHPIFTEWMINFMKELEEKEDENGEN